MCYLRAEILMFGYHTQHFMHRGLFYTHHVFHFTIFLAETTLWVFRHSIYTAWYFLSGQNGTCAEYSYNLCLVVSRSSFVCGLAGALASNPVDVVRTRMMNQRGGALYQGTVDCLLQVSQHSQMFLFKDDYVNGAFKHFCNRSSIYIHYSACWNCVVNYLEQSLNTQSSQTQLKNTQRGLLDDSEDTKLKWVLKPVCFLFRRGVRKVSWPSIRVSFPTGSAWDRGTSLYPLTISLVLHFVYLYNQWCNISKAGEICREKLFILLCIWWRKVFILSHVEESLM